LGFTQSLGKLHDAELLAARPYNNADFAGANSTVYTKLRLQIKSISWPAKRECTVTPLFYSSQSSTFHFRKTLTHSASARLRRSATTDPHIAGRGEVVNNISALAR
jgi:hypothetical protein